MQKATKVATANMFASLICLKKMIIIVNAADKHPKIPNAIYTTTKTNTKNIIMTCAQ